MADVQQNSGRLSVRLVTPERVLVECTADAVELPASTGYMEVLYGHAPLLSELGAGVVTLHGAAPAENKDATASAEILSDRYFVAWGFVEVLPTQVTILAETAKIPKEIDTAAAQAELNRGHKEWNEAGDDAEKYDVANETIHEAEEKLAAAGAPTEKH
jgi:F-type H+-transporting ATPase subunit epsilon